MALSFLTVPAFPNVPFANGVPPVVRQLGATINTVALLAADAKSLLSLFNGPRWGLYVKSKPVLVADSIVAVDVRQEYRISDFPIEDGGFFSYDKVVTPGDLRVTLAVSGQNSSILSSLFGGLTSLINIGGGISTQETVRQAFLIGMNTLARSLDLIDVIVPEGTYYGYNITHFDYRREAREGATMLKIEVWLQEVRRAPGGSFTTPPVDPASPIPAPKNPASADSTSTGTVQSSPLKPDQAATLPIPPGGVGPTPSASIDTGSGASTANVDVGGAYTIPAGADPAYYFGGQYVGANPSDATIAAIRAAHGAP